MKTYDDPGGPVTSQPWWLAVARAFEARHGVGVELTDEQWIGRATSIGARSAWPCEALACRDPGTSPFSTPSVHQEIAAEFIRKVRT